MSLKVGDVVIPLVLLLVACVLLVANYQFSEGFANPVGMCGLDLPPCPHGSRCMNGYCSSVSAPIQPSSSGLPVYPDGYIR
jgi:hypothetical protein